LLIHPLIKSIDIPAPNILMDV